MIAGDEIDGDVRCRDIGMKAEVRLFRKVRGFERAKASIEKIEDA